MCDGKRWKLMVFVKGGAKKAVVVFSFEQINYYRNYAFINRSFVYKINQK